jgi:hypothetical protein
VVKKSVLFFLLALVPTFALPARLSVSPQVGYMSLSDANSPFVFGAAFDGDIYSNLALGFSGLYGTARENPDRSADLDDEETLHIMSSAFLQYRYPISRFPLYVTGELQVGYARTEIRRQWQTTDLKTERKSDQGGAIAVNLGLQYDFNQSISGWVKGGYYNCIYGGDLDAEGISVSGAMVSFGLKINVWGVNRPLKEGY